MTDPPSRPGTTLGDLLVVVVATLAVGAAVLLGRLDGPARLLLSVPLLFFLPGYALLTVLFPGRRALEGDDRGRPPTTVLGSRSVGWRERVALSFASSLALLPLLGVLLSLLRAPLAVGPLVGAVASFTVLTAGLGVLRRLQLPPDRRFAVPTDRWLAELRGGTVDAPSWADAALNLVLVVVVVAALAGLAYGVTSPQRSEQYTEAALLTDEGDSLVAGNYTTTVSEGQPMSTTLTVENHEGSDRRYSLVVVLERVRTTDGGPTVLERRELARESVGVADGETATLSPTVRPSLLGEDLRLSYYLYAGDAPDSASAATADRHLFLWVDVTPTGGGDAGTDETNALAPTASGGGV
jgi:uncharacterized membrane protein